MSHYIQICNVYYDQNVAEPIRGQLGDTVTSTILAIVAVGVSLGILTASLAGLILRGQSTMNTAIQSLQSDVGDLRERMARLEGLFDGLTKREVGR